MTAPHHPLHHWIPYRLIYQHTEGWLLEWLNLSDQQITEPFFEETISRCRHRQMKISAAKSCSGLDLLLDTAEQIPCLIPSAFIFHVSRCGSTLLSQAFAEQEQNIVISEAPLLDEILRAEEKDKSVTANQKEEWFKAALNLMGQQRNFKEDAFIIKLDCWHVHFYDQLRLWFPDTPFFFLSRRPEEVIASHEKKRGMHVVPGMVDNDLLKINPAIDYQGDLNAFAADVLQGYYEQLICIRQFNHSGNKFFDYAAGVQEMIAEFASFTATVIQNPEQLSQRLTYHSKDAREIFKGDLPADKEKLYYKNCLAAYHKLIQI